MIWRGPADLLVRLAMAAILWLAPGSARAGNDESILLGSEATISGGAVTSFVSDGAAAYYNPAGLALSRRNTLDVTASLYGLRINSSTGLIVTPDGTELNSDAVDWILVPSALSYVRELGEWIGSFGIFVPQRTDIVLRADATTELGARWNYVRQEVNNETNYTLGFARAYGDRLRFGFSAVGVYQSTYVAEQLGAGIPGTGNPSLVLSEIRSEGNYGLRGIVGVQWDPNDRLKLGLSLTTPTLTGASSRVSTLIGSLNSVDPPENEYVLEDTSGLVWPWEMTAPFRVRFGASLWLKRWTFAIDGDVSSPVRRDAVELNRTWSGNGRLAAGYRLSETVTLGTGLFTDLSAAEHYRRDFLGLALGMRFEKNYTLEGGSPMTFSTSIGGRYAYGWGSTEGVRIDGDSSGNLTATPQEAHFTSHELMLNLTSFVTF